MQVGCATTMKGFLSVRGQGWMRRGVEREFANQLIPRPFLYQPRHDMSRRRSPFQSL